MTEPKTETTNILRFPSNWRPATKEECREAWRKHLGKIAEIIPEGRDARRY